MSSAAEIAVRERGSATDDVARLAIRRPLAADEIAWLLLVPAAACVVVAIRLLARPLGRLLVSRAHYHFFPIVAPIEPIPIHQAGYLIAVALMIGLAGVALVVARRPPRMSAPLVVRLVLATQAAGVALVAWCWIAQRHLHIVRFPTRVYFTAPTVAVAAVLAVATSVAATRPAARGLLARTRGARLARRGCLAVAVLLTVVWLLPSLFTDGDIGLALIGVTHHIRYTFDESMAVLDGRSPLVDFAGYTSLWPYVVALPLAALGASVGAFTGLMTSLTALALLAVYGVLRRVTRHPLAALLLYAPFLATSLFIVTGSVERYTFGNYYAEFPLRYAGPYFLAWLTARRIEGERPRRLDVLFAIAGLVLINNVEFGLPALLATVLALLAAQRPARLRETWPLLRSLGVGVAIAFALVCALTLARAGTLPRFGVFLQYASVFGFAGFGRVPVPTLGLHLVIALTLVGALLTAAVRVARNASDRLLTAMLAWIGIFGLGAAQYFANRPGPDVLIAFFSIWALALALLVVVAARALAGTRDRRLLLIPALAVLFGFGLACASLAQVPLPWQQVQRLERVTSAPAMKLLPVRDFVAARTHRGERIALFLALGHRVAREAGVVDVEVSAGLDLMPTAEQVNSSLHALRREGGRKVFIGEFVWPEMPGALAAAGYQELVVDRRSGFSEWLAPRHPADIAPVASE
jgi:hypothetical protein